MTCKEKNRIMRKDNRPFFPFLLFLFAPPSPEIFMTNPCRMLIAAPPGLMRRSLRAVLATFPTVELIGEADGCLSAKFMSETLKPDILLIAAGLPEKEVTMLLQEIQREEQHKPYSIVLVNTNNQKQAARAAGADAVLWQSGSTQELEDILQQFRTITTSRTGY